jgi:hypothetical protein
MTRLFGRGDRYGKPTGARDTRAEAEAWMQRNPDVYRLFERFALAMADRGRRFGINQLREKVRWETNYDWGDEAFKFCNTYSPYVARQLLRDHPHLEHYMRCRPTKDERAGGASGRTHEDHGSQTC